MTPPKENHGEDLPRPCEGRYRRSEVPDWPSDQSSCFPDERIRDDDGSYDAPIDTGEEADAKFYLWDGEEIFEIGFSINDPVDPDDDNEVDQFLSTVIDASMYAYANREL